MEKKEMKRWAKIFLIAAIVWTAFILIASSFFSSSANAQYMPINCRFQWTADCERVARMNELETQQQILNELRSNQTRQNSLDFQRTIDEINKRQIYGN